MLASWFERGLGQIVAPDEKVKSSSKEEREEGFWSVVAPDPNYEGSQHGEKRVGPPPSAFLSPIPGGSDQVKCVNCKQWTPVAPSTPSPRALTTSDNSGTPSALDTLVLSAAKETAESMISPPSVADARNKVFRLCASQKPLSDKLYKKLRRMLQQDPNLASARASHLGNLVPDGYTPLMATAAINHVVAAEIILELAPEVVNEVDLQGRTALHIAAELGCIQMVDLLKSRHPEGPDAPLDLTGHTPLGRAVTSQHKTAKQNQFQLKEKLFSPGDRSVCGWPTPAKTRSAQLDLQLAYGYADIPGFRVVMEDSISCHVWTGHALFGVCDGHGDRMLVSEFVAERVAPILKEQLSANTDVIAAWTATCLELDAQLKETGRKGGSTAIWAFVTETSVIVANVGDSRCILIQKPGLEQAMEQLKLDDEKVRKQDTTKAEESAADEKQPAEAETQDDEQKTGKAGEAVFDEKAPMESERARSYVVTPLSKDHKPNLELEQARIEKAGLSVTAETFMDKGEECTIHKVRLSGTDRLAVSRAFGDFEYKANGELAADEQAVVATPEIRIHARDKERDMYLVLACDGVWDVMSSDEVGDFVVKNVQDAIEAEEEDILPQVGDMLVSECLKRGSMDNMTAVIVALSTAAEALGGPSDIKGKALDFQAD